MFEQQSSVDVGINSDEGSHDVKGVLSQPPLRLTLSSDNERVSSDTGGCFDYPQDSGSDERDVEDSWVCTDHDVAPRISDELPIDDLSSIWRGYGVVESDEDYDDEGRSERPNEAVVDRLARTGDDRCRMVRRSRTRRV
jgi:hypothetical protein